MRQGYVTLILAIVLVACASQPEETTAVNQPVPVAKILRITLENNPATIDPRYIVDDEGEQVVDALFDPLVRLDRSFRIVPSAAQSFRVSEDGLRYTFVLRDAQFHDGSTVTANDFVRSFNAIADGLRTPQSFLDYLLRDVAGITAARRFGAPLSGVRALDDRTLEITLRQPRAAFLQILTDPSLVPLPAIADTDPETFARAPIGNGAFHMVGQYEPGSFIRLARFDSHHIGAQVDEVLFTLFPNDPTREAQWQAFTDRQAQVAYIPPQRRTEAFRRYGLYDAPDRNYGVHDGLTSAVYLYTFDTSRPPFDDVRMRQAISLALDRESIARDVMGSTRVAATSLIPTSLPGAVSGLCQHCLFDPEQAVALFQSVTEEKQADLDPSTYSDLEEEIILTLLYPRGAVHTLIAERMGSAIQDVLPISVNLRAVDLGTAIAQRGTFDASLLRIGWRSSVFEPAEYFEPLFGSAFSAQGSVTGFLDRAVDERLLEYRAIESVPIRRFLYQQLERQLLDDATVLPVLWYRQERVIASDVENAFLFPSGRLDLVAVDIGQN